MHSPKFCNIFRRKTVVVTDEPRSDSAEVPGGSHGDGSHDQHSDSVVEYHNTEKPLPSLPEAMSDQVRAHDMPVESSIYGARRCSYRPLYWPNNDRAPSMMHFYVPSRSSSSASSTDMPNGIFQDFSQSFTNSNKTTSSSPDLRPGALSRISNNSLGRRDSKLGSITIQCHPAILDNPPPFSRHSSPPKLNCRPDLTQQKCATWTTTLQRQVSILEIRSDIFSTRLEQTLQDLENMTCTRDVTRHMLSKCNELRLQAEQNASVWSEKYHQIYNGIESLLRANNAMEKQLRDLDKAHATCAAREAVLNDRIDTLPTSRWRGSTYLKRRLIETNDRNNILVAANSQQSAMIDTLRARNITLQRTFEETAEKIEKLEEEARMAKVEREEDTEALQLAEREVYQLSERLREVNASLRDRSAELEGVVQEKDRLEALLRLMGEGS